MVSFVSRTVNISELKISDSLCKAQNIYKIESAGEVCGYNEKV